MNEQLVLTPRDRLTGNYTSQMANADLRELVQRQSERLKEVTAERDALRAACKLVSNTCGDAMAWNGETRAFLLAVEAALGLSMERTH